MCTLYDAIQVRGHAGRHRGAGPIWELRAGGARTQFWDFILSSFLVWLAPSLHRRPSFKVVDLLGDTEVVTPFLFGGAGWSE